MLTDVGRDGGEASCYAERYSDADAQRVLDYLTERREDGASVKAIANGTKVDEGAVEQIVMDLLQTRPPQLRKVCKGGVWLIFPPLESYDTSVSEAASAETPTPEEQGDTPGRIRCRVKGCDTLIKAHKASFVGHCMDVHGIGREDAERAWDGYRDGTYIELEGKDKPHYSCKWCGKDLGTSHAFVARHEPYCHANPDHERNIYEMRVRKYGPDRAIWGDVTRDKIEAVRSKGRGKKGTVCPVCGERDTGKGCWPRTMQHLVHEHGKTAKEAKDLLKLASAPCTGEQEAIGARVAEHIQAGPEKPKAEPEPQCSKDRLGRLIDDLNWATMQAEGYGFRVRWVLEPKG